MCSRYTIKKDEAKIKLREKIEVFGCVPRGDIRPTDLAPVILPDEDSFSCRENHSFEGVLTDEDERILNCGQIENMSQAVYASAGFPEDVVRQLGEIFIQKKEARCSVNEQTWSLSMKIVLPEFAFSFVKLNPPLM